MSDFLQQKSLILASESKSRAALLGSIQLSFATQAANIDEAAIKALWTDTNFKVLAQKLACEKALLISRLHPEAYVIAADQLCVCGDIIFDKPLQHRVAVEHLNALQGREHQQLCAMSIARQGMILWQQVDIARLWMRSLSPVVIEAYLRSEQPYYSCGAYHFEGPAKCLFYQVQGSDSSIQGLALTPLIEGLIQCGAIALKEG